MASKNHLFAGIIATKVHKIEKLLKEKGILLYMPFIIALSMWGIAMTKYSAIFYIVISVIESILYVPISDYINKLIPSENRATILSFQSMIFSLFMIVIFPIIGRIGDAISLSFAFKLMAGVGSIFALVNLYILLNLNETRIEKQEKSL